MPALPKSSLLIRPRRMARSLAVPAAWIAAIAGVPWVGTQRAIAITGFMLWLSIRETVTATRRVSDVMMGAAVDSLIREIESPSRH